MDIKQILKTKKSPRKPYAELTPKEKEMIKRLRIAVYAPPHQARKLYDEIFNELYGKTYS